MPIQDSTLLFDPSALRNDVFLDTKQEAFVRATISSTQDLIAGLDAKIRDTENALAELHKQRDTALETMAIPAAFLAPVRRLPPEVLGEIFQRCVPIEPTHVTPFDSRDAPLLLTRICHRWRRVTQGTPLLWNKFVLYGRTPESRFSPIWLNNSGSLPLEISVRRYPYGPSSGRSHGDDPIDVEYTGHGWRMDRYPIWLWPKCVSDQTSQMAVEKLSRIRRLSLICAANEVRGYFPKEAAASLPSLQELCVKSTYRRVAHRTDYTFHNILTPRLQTLDLNGCAEFLLPALESTSNLRNLAIRGKCTLEMFVDFVSRHPGLQRLHASDLNVKYPWESMDMSPIILPGLSHLGLGVSHDSVRHFDEEVEFDGEGWIRRMKSLERLRTPNLQSMEIQLLPYFGRILSKCMADSQSGLHALTIRGMVLVATTLGDATSIFTSIEKLEIISCAPSVAGFWESLTHAEDTPSQTWTLPKLKSLLLEGVQIATEHQAEFVRFVERRAPPMRFQGQRSLEEIRYLEIELNQCAFSLETFNALERLRTDREGFSITIKGESFVKDEAGVASSAFL